MSHSEKLTPGGPPAPIDEASFERSDAVGRSDAVERSDAVDEAPIVDVRGVRRVFG